MLRVGKVRPGGAGYYLEVGPGGTGIEAAGRWIGPGPGTLSLSGRVESDAFAAVLAGEDPVTGQVLGTARPRVRVAAFDLTFCAPKSVSLLEALGDPEVASAVRAGHAGAVEEAVGYVARAALAVRRRTGPGGPALPVAATGTPTAGFVHRLSRALDPHLHTHVVVANLGRDSDGAWSALDGRGVYAHASTIDALYHVHLRHELTRRLGVAWEAADRGRADISGIGPEMRRTFSQRSAEIAAHMTQRGLTSGRAAAVAWVVTRADKDRRVGAEDLRLQWQDRARRVGLGPERLQAVLDRVPRRQGGDTRPPQLRWAEVATGVARTLAASGRPVARRDVVRAWSRPARGGPGRRRRSRRRPPPRDSGSGSSDPGPAVGPGGGRAAP